MRKSRLPAIVILVPLAILLPACAPSTNVDDTIAGRSPAIAAALPRPEITPKYTAAELASEVHSVHAPFGLPYGVPVSNDLIFRHSYTASTNDTTKLADWVAYTVSTTLIGEPGDPARNYRSDPFLDETETLEARPGMGDYENAHASAGYDRGHLVPLRSFHGSSYLQEVNILSVMAPQIDDLNRGPWKSLEGGVRRLVEDHDDIAEVYVFAGPYYDPGIGPMPELPLADEEHVVPTGFWMIVYTTTELQVCAFVMPQQLPPSREVAQFITAVDVIEGLTGLDFFSLLSTEVETEIEERIALEWYQDW